MCVITLEKKEEEETEDDHQDQDRLVVSLFAC